MRLSPPACETTGWVWRHFLLVLMLHHVAYASFSKNKKKIDAMDLQVAILRNSSLLENLGKSYFPSMIWLRSTASTIASQVSSTTYDCGYSFSADSFQRLVIMAPLPVWLSIAPIMGFCQELTTMVPLLASSQEFMTMTLFWLLLLRPIFLGFLLCLLWVWAYLYGACYISCFMVG